MNRVAGVAVLVVALTLTGCSVGEPTVVGPLDDALGVPTAELLHAQIVEGWAGMSTAADQNCVAEMTGATPDSAGFLGAEATYEQGLAGLTATGRPTPAGYPTDISAVDLTHWCVASETLDRLRR